MEVGQGPKWGSSAKEKKHYETPHYALYVAPLSPRHHGMARPQIADGEDCIQV
jgi:hypothetical protein